MSPREPLWLPRGSVRAIIALVVVIAFVIAFLTGVAKVDPKDFGAIVVIVVTAYFITRSSGPTSS